MARSLPPTTPKPPPPPNVSTLTPPATATYPDGLLEKYKALMRDRYLGPLSPQQERGLAQVKQEIQAISRQDGRSQSAARQVEEVNISLQALEAQVDARIAQREAEQKGEVGRPA